MPQSYSVLVNTKAANRMPPLTMRVTRSTSISISFCAGRSGYQPLWLALCLELAEMTLRPDTQQKSSLDQPADRSEVLAARPTLSTLFVQA